MAAEEYRIQFSATGAEGTIAAAGGVQKAVDGVGAAADKGGSGFANFGTSLVSFASRAAVVGAAFSAISSGLNEIAEIEAATAALTKAGVAADDLAEALKAVDEIELFTGDKVSAAQLYGNIVNGRTGALKQYGLVLGENATLEEKLALIQQVRTRGLQLDAAAVGTLTGEWERFKRGIGGVIETGANWVVSSTGIKDALGFVNKEVLGLNASMPTLAQNTRTATEAFKASEVAVDNANAKLSENLRLINALASGLGKQGDDAENRIFNANIDRDLAEGKITPEDATRQRAQREADNAEIQRQNSATDAERVKEMARQERERIRREMSDEQIRSEAESGAQNIVDPNARRSAVEQEVKRRQDERSKALLALDEAESKAAAELQKRADEARAARAELEAKLAQADRAESEKAMQAGKDREADAAKNNAEKLKAAEAELEQRRKQAEAAKQLSEEIAKRQQEADGLAREAAKETDRDEGGRRKIRAPKSPNELAPLPDRTPKAADKLAEVTKDAGAETGKALDDTAKEVARTAQTMVGFAQQTTKTLMEQRSELDALSRRMNANL